MIYSISGKVVLKNKDFVVIENNGIGFKIYTSLETYNKLPKKEETVHLFSHLYVREDKMDLYGFQTESELHLFGLLIGVSGIGPKTALGVLSVASIQQLEAAIASGKIELFTKTPGIGKKTAQRVILELKNKVVAKDEETIQRLEIDIQAEEALVTLGYSRTQARESLRNISKKIKGVEARLKEALQMLSSHKNTKT